MGREGEILCCFIKERTWAASLGSLESMHVVKRRLEKGCFKAGEEVEKRWKRSERVVERRRVLMRVLAESDWPW